VEKTALQWAQEPLRNYAKFTGRASRSEYWWFFLLSFAVLIVASVLDRILGLSKLGVGPLYGIGALALIVPSIAVGIRRLHDQGKSGWYYLIGLIPLVGGLVLLYWFVTKGTTGTNEFGGDPALPFAVALA
jgi:uncharacterized membrane protein YhaH (DUF805 family)